MIMQYDYKRRGATGLTLEGAISSDGGLKSREPAARAHVWASHTASQPCRFHCESNPPSKKVEVFRQTSGREAVPVKGKNPCQASDFRWLDVLKEPPVVWFCSGMECAMSLERWWGEETPAPKGSCRAWKDLQLWASHGSDMTKCTG